MILIDFLKHCKEMIDENPEALKMEMFAEHGASGALDEISHPFIDKISRWKNSDMPIEDMLPSDYPYDSVIRVYIGN